MTINPYEPPLDLPQPRARSVHLVLAWVSNAPKRFPATSIALGVAGIVTVLFVIKQYQIELIIAKEGGFSGTPSLLDTLSIPGIFSAYVAVSLTNSLIAAVLAGVLGMAVAYGVPGLLFDVCWRQLSNRS